MTSYDFTPINMRANARAWFKMYELSLIEVKNDTNFWMASFICFCFALELYLKSYIVLKDKNMAKESEMKHLNHSFKKISDKINEIGPKKFALKVEKKLNKYNFRNNNFIELRYPKSGRMVTFYQSMLYGDHGFVDIISEIDIKISKMDFEKWQQL